MTDDWLHPSQAFSVGLDAATLYLKCEHSIKIANDWGAIVKARIIGSIGGALLGAFFGGGTGIVGGVFGAIAGVSVFTIIGAVWGFSAGPDIARFIQRWKSR